MTVLDEYQRLESLGLWRPETGAQRREVVVSIGEATLLLAEPNGRPLTHWSLPAMQRLNPGEIPALYAPDRTSGEELEIADATMTDAIERVLRALARARSRPGRVRGAAMLAAVLLAVALGVLWLPGAVTRYVAGLLPPAVERNIGRALLAEITTLTGAPCETAAGRRALDRLAERLFPGAAPRLVVLPSALAGTASLPGGMVLIGRPLVEDHETPEALAGFLLAEDLRRAETPAILDALRRGGAAAAVAVMTRGELPRGVLSRHAAELVAGAPAPVPQETLARRMVEAGIAPRDHALALDVTGESVVTLFETRAQVTRPVLSDGDWLALQSICEAN